MNTIIVYGPGCAKCTQVQENAKVAAAQLGGEFTIQKVSDPMQFAAAGVFITPALSLNGKLLFSGRTPHAAEIKEMIEQELGTSDAPASCGCGCGCSGRDESKPNVGKKLLLWMVLIVIALAAIKTINRQRNEAAAPPAAESSLTPTESNSLTLCYYKLGVECVTCQRMEKWIQEAITANFAAELANGQLVLKSIKPSEDEVLQYELTTKSLIARKGGEWNNLTEIWTHKDDEEAFKSYVISETQKLIN